MISETSRSKKSGFLNSSFSTTFTIRAQATEPGQYSHRFFQAVNFFLYAKIGSHRRRRSVGSFLRRSGDPMWALPPSPLSLYWRDLVHNFLPSRLHSSCFLFAEGEKSGSCAAVKGPPQRGEADKEEEDSVRLSFGSKQRRSPNSKFALFFLRGGTRNDTGRGRGRRADAKRASPPVTPHKRARPAVNSAAATAGDECESVSRRRAEGEDSLARSGEKPSV